MIYAVGMNIREAQKISDKVVKALFEKLEEQNITNYKISHDCAISEAALSYIKSGKRQPRLLVLLMIAETYGLSLADIIRQVESKLPDTKKDSV